MIAAINMDLNDLKRLIGRTCGFPTLPTVITQILTVLNDPGSSASDVARIIKQDQTLTADLLRLVNSAAYGLGHEVVSIDEAIALVGFNTVKSLAIGAAVMDAFQLKAFNMKQFWQHTIAVSITTRSFAESLRLSQYVELASTLGLIHDIGKLAFMTEIPVQYYQVVRASIERKDISIYVERDLLGVDHCQAGQILSERWGWPKVYQDVIGYHHKPQQAGANQLLVFAVYLGNLAAHALYDTEYRGISLQDALEPTSCHEELIKRITPSNWKIALNTLKQKQDEIQSFVEVMI